jgi:hypothetical protein
VITAMSITRGATPKTNEVVAIIDQIRGPQASTLWHVRGAIRVIVQLGIPGVFASGDPSLIERRIHAPMIRDRRVIADWVCEKGTPEARRLWAERAPKLDNLKDASAARDRVLTSGAAFHAILAVKGGDVGKRRVATWLAKRIAPALADSTAGHDLDRLRLQHLLA